MIKQKTHRICANDGCNNRFQMFRTTDKYCSRGCFNDNKVRIKPISDKHRERLKEYNSERKKYISHLKDHFCPVMLKIKGFRVRITDIHHMAGRKGKLLLYTPYWLPVSRQGHNWIHDNPGKAYELGFLIPSTSVNI